MRSVEAIPVLNRLLQSLCGSLSMYLADARPSGLRTDQVLLQSALDHLVADQHRYIQRLVETITELGGRPDSGRFPTGFTAKNDLSLDYLLHDVIDDQEQHIATIERCVMQLANDPPLHSLAEEILGNARGHHDLLRDALQIGSSDDRA
jgi:hypothetical protein